VDVFISRNHEEPMHVRKTLEKAIAENKRESCERSVARLSRTYLARMEALKNYRATAQQTGCDQSVTVANGGQPVADGVSTRGKAGREK
jgi:hypothetical protein